MPSQFVFPTAECRGALPPQHVVDSDTNMPATAQPCILKRNGTIATPNSNVNHVSLKSNSAAIVGIASGRVHNILTLHPLKPACSPPNRSLPASCSNALYQPLRFSRRSSTDRAPPSQQSWTVLNELHNQFRWRSTTKARRSDTQTIVISYSALGRTHLLVM